MRRMKKQSHDSKLNVVPILDAVFIFIFFLLMSAQFVQVREIGSDAPKVSMVENNKKEKDPLNLTLDIEDEKIIVRTGVAGTIVKEIGLLNGNYNFEELKSLLISLKMKNPTEKTAIFRPDKKVSYERIVKLMDEVAQSVDLNRTPAEEVHQKGEQAKREQLSDISESYQTKLFDEIVFETAI